MIQLCFLPFSTQQKKKKKKKDLNELSGFPQQRRPASTELINHYLHISSNKGSHDKTSEAC